MKSTILRVVAVTAMLSAPARGTSSEEEATRAQVLVLGVYHMANPGHDVFNIQADDVLAPKRQQEIAELTAVLKKFSPTRIGASMVPRESCVLQTLLYMNSDAMVAQDVGFYYREARYGEPGDYAGPDLLAEWYKRNIRIYNNVTKLVATPEDHVLVIFGSGHLGWLRQDFDADPTLRLRKLKDFVPTATGGAERH